MKPIKISLLLTFALAVLMACDKVQNPLPVKETAVGTNFITKTNIAKAHIKKVLLEDYTGHQCGNCPAAAIVAENLGNKYKDTLIVIAVHAGFFARTNATYATSYTTTAGNDWDGSTGFGVSAVGNPNGMVNRKVYPSFTLIQKETAWPASVAVAKNDPFIVRVELTTNYDTSAKALNVSTKLKFAANYANSVKLNLVIMQDSLVGDQKDYSVNPDHVEDYEFMHMLRGDINGSWGVTAKDAPIVANDSVKIENNNFAVNSIFTPQIPFNDKKLYVVAIVYDAVTREVLQVEKVKIR